MKAHVVPEFYLKGFTDPDTPDGQEPYLWKYALKDSAWRRKAPSNVATRTDYYIVQDQNGNSHTDFEDALSRIETSAAPLIRNKIARRDPLDDSDREVLAMFVALMEARLPDRIERFGAFITRIGDMMMSRYRQVFREDPDYLEEFKRQYRAETGRSDLDNLTLEALDPELVKIQANRAAVLGALFRGTETTCDFLLGMGWDLLVTSPPHWFISSDDPCARVDPEAPTGPNAHGFANPSLEVTFPLTSALALCATWRTNEVRYIGAPPRAVRQVNLRTVLHAREFIAAPKETFPGDQEVMRFLSQRLSGSDGTANGD